MEYIGNAMLGLFAAKCRWVAFCLALAGALVVRTRVEASPPVWQKIEEGLESATLRCNGPPCQSSIRLRILRVDPEKFAIRVIDARALGTDRLEVKEMARKTQALAVINGGFFLPDYRPLGLLVVEGKEVNPLRKTDWGVFIMQENRPRILHTRDYAQEKGVTQALQVGPRLVVDGRELRLKKQVARRSAVGVNGKGQVLLVHTEDTDAYAQDLARIFYLPEKEGGLECTDALTLDGGPSAQMYADYKSLKIDLPGGWPVPNGIGVFKRQP